MPSSGATRSVAYIYPFAFQYRNPFHERLRERLAEHGVRYDFIYCGDPHFDGPRGDLIAPEWAIPVNCTSFKPRHARLRYQHALRRALGYDLVILQQENALLLNYPVQMLARLFGTKVAFFGHGRNFQARDRQSRAERFKRFWTSKVDWWFAYTGRSARIVAETGFPSDRITAFNNAIDTSAIAAEMAALPPDRVETLRRSLVENSHNVGVYVGALYPDKRLGFLIEAARAIRSRVPDFHLIVIGGGEDTPLAEAAAAELSWVHYLGPRFGAEKTELVALASVLLMPGLVGLAVLDSFAYGIPMVTTRFPYHSPEIDYLEDGVNGIVTDDDVAVYGDAVCRVLTDAPFRDGLRAGAATAASTYTIEAMVERFADGVMRALDRS